MNVFDSSDIPTDAARQLTSLAEKFKGDKGFLIDLYLLCAQPFPNLRNDAELVEGLARHDPAYWSYRTKITSRKDFLESMRTSPYMQELRKLSDPMAAVLQFIADYEKARAAEAAVAGNPVATTIEHTGNAIFVGYADEALLSKLPAPLDEDFDEYLSALVLPLKFTDPGLSAFVMSSCGSGRYHTATTDPAYALAGGVVKHAIDLPTAYPLLYREFTRIVEELGAAGKVGVDTDKDMLERRRDKMTEYEQVSSVDVAALAQDGFEAQYAQKKVEVDHPQDEEAGICHLYILLDVTGSMHSTDLGGRISRAWAANVLALSLLRFAYDGRWHVHVIPFSGAPGAAQHAVSPESATEVMAWLGQQRYDGGATNIEKAVLAAYEDVQNDPTYRKCDIVLLTDGCSPISSAVSTRKPARTKLRTLFTASELPYGAHAQHLIDASDTHSLVGFDNMTAQLTFGDALKAISSRSSNDVSERMRQEAQQEEEDDGRY
jgi:Mg-chelatase subunit ChlD